MSVNSSYGLRSFVAHGEAGSASVEDAEAERQRLRVVCSDYRREDIFNMDETSFFYRQLPSRGLAFGPMQGVKQDKTRLTLALCCNAAGSEKLPPLYIGKSAKPKCFGGRSPKTRGFLYEHSKKAWMNNFIFEAWIKQIDEDFRLKDRHILLLVDNFSGHALNSYTPSNIRLEFFAPNLTSLCQPLDQGIIATVKMYYHKLKAIETASKVEADVADPFQIDQLNAMVLMDKVWSEITARTIVNCWSKAGFLLTAVTSAPQGPSHPRVDNKAWRVIFRLFDDSNFSIPEAEDGLRHTLGTRYNPSDWQSVMSWSCVEESEPAALAEARLRAEVEKRAREEELGSAGDDEPVALSQLEQTEIELSQALVSLGWNTATSRIAIQSLITEEEEPPATEEDLKEIDVQVFNEIAASGSVNGDEIVLSSTDDEDMPEEVAEFGGELAGPKLQEIRDAIRTLVSLGTHRREEAWSEKLLEGLHGVTKWERSYTTSKLHKQGSLDAFVVRTPRPM